ncbi:hypothetical protein V6N11_080994 [Hibiscus sabdariffa]|uniref:Uncharacterized protein n=1 Tax=Hibiscus sabdariffa TaxID=183260 RepID=A0ABR2QJ43_9ROSI
MNMDTVSENSIVQSNPIGRHLVSAKSICFRSRSSGNHLLLLLFPVLFSIATRNNKNVIPSPLKNKPLLVDYKPSEGEGSLKEHNPNETVLERSNSTRVEDATALVTGKVLHIEPMVNAKAMVISSDILGEAIDPGLSGIMAAHNEKECGTKQLANDASVMSGGFFNWNTSRTLQDQICDKSIRGKSKISEEGVNEQTDKTMEDFMADSLKDMGLSFKRKRKGETSSFSARKRQD